MIGVPSEQWGEAIHAVVQLREEATATEQELLDFAAERLTGYKKPRLVEFVGEMPISATGKILKKVLRRTNTNP